MFNYKVLQRLLESIVITAAVATIATHVPVAHAAQLNTQTQLKTSAEWNTDFNPKVDISRLRLLDSTLLNVALQQTVDNTGLDRLTLKASFAQEAVRQSCWWSGLTGVKHCSVEPLWITVADAYQTWDYYTYGTEVYASYSNPVASDYHGADPSLIPSFLTNAALQNAAERSGLPLTELAIAQIQGAYWTNGCMGSYHPFSFCSMALVPTWLITVTDQQRHWTYSANGRYYDYRVFPLFEAWSFEQDHMMAAHSQSTKIPGRALNSLPIRLVSVNPPIPTSLIIAQTQSVPESSDLFGLLAVSLLGTVFTLKQKRSHKLFPSSHSASS